jgi:membrane protease YdiL (CAAX protease family)
VAAPYISGQASIDAARPAVTETFSDPTAENSPLRRARLAGEFALLFLIAPALQFTFFGTLGVFGPIAAVCLVAAVLLHLTPGWRWRELVDLRGLLRWLPFVAGFAALAAGVIAALVLWLAPGAFLSMPQHRPELWLTIMALYPVLSVLGQEIVFRPLFFRRYGFLLGGPWPRILVNAFVFALAHLFYQNWIALSLTFAGGAAFGYAYEKSGSFPVVFLMHMLAGQALFTLGLGGFFYHGAIPS